MNDTPDHKSAVKLTLRPNGSILVEGPVEMIGPDGAGIEVREKFALCRCGASQKKPFCDGSHKECGFDSSPF
ncbi:MAG: CDGSH iron-sulfur domain-containing protein [Candidatus Zixiibacteriota bacterium]